MKLGAFSVIVFAAACCDAVELSLPQYDAENPDRQEQVNDVADRIQNLPRTWQIGDSTCKLNDGPVAVPGSLAEQIIADDIRGLNSTVPFEDLGRVAAISASFAPQIQSLDDYTAMYQALAEGTSDLLTIPTTHNRIDDESFAGNRLGLQGQNLERVREGTGRIGLRVDRAIVRDVCGRGSLNLLRRLNRLYKEDYSWTARYNDPAGTKYAPSCVAYFCVTEDERFMPLAIKVMQPPDEPGGVAQPDLVYTKFDTQDEWTLAKMAVNANYISVITVEHLMEIHFFLDPMRVTLLRNVHPSHPIYNLLWHHLAQNTGVVVRGLRILLSPGTDYDLVTPWGALGSCQYIEDQFEAGGVKVTFQSFEEQMNRQGLNELSGYKYREDVTKLMRAVRRFLRQHLRAYYVRGAADIKADTELQAFASETSQFIKGFPSSIVSVKQLIGVLSNVIYASAIRHHIKNNDVAWDASSFPYSVPSLHHPWPAEKGQPINLKNYVLPNELVVSLNVLAALFSRNVTLDVYLWKSYTQSGVDLGTRSDRAIAQFESRMQAIDEFIETREAGEEIPFAYLRPSRLPYFTWA